MEYFLNLKTLTIEKCHQYDQLVIEVPDFGAMSLKDGVESMQATFTGLLDNVSSNICLLVKVDTEDVDKFDALSYISSIIRGMKPTAVYTRDYYYIPEKLQPQLFGTLQSLKELINNEYPIERIQIVVMGRNELAYKLAERVI